jgi:hypothetical protein
VTTLGGRPPGHGRAEAAQDNLRLLQADHDKLKSDAGYLLRHILDCRKHYTTDRIRSLIRRYGETLRADLRTVADGGISTVTPCGTGWPD